MNFTKVCHKKILNLAYNLNYEIKSVKIIFWQKSNMAMNL